MKVWEIRDAFGFENLRLVERPEPDLGRGQVTVEVGACSFNYRDFLMTAGLYNPKQKLPLVPLSDGAGTVVAIGDEVRDLAVGDRVAGTFFRDWLGRPVPSRELLKRTRGGPIDGMLAERVCLEEREVVKIPGHLDFAEASTLPCAALTAWSALVAQGGVGPHDTVVIQGTGGVALFALQFATMAGARTIITSSSDERLERARSLGATETINYRTEPKWGKRVAELTGGEGASHVVELGGGDTFEQSLRAIRPGGTIHMIGVLGGTRAPFDVLPVVMQNVRLQGVLVGPRQDFERMNAAIEHHALRPTVDRVVPFEEAGAALESFGNGGHFGKVCVKVREED